MSYGLTKVFDFPGADVEPLWNGHRDGDAPGRNGSEAGDRKFPMRRSVTWQKVSAARREDTPLLPAALAGGERIGWVEEGWARSSALGGHIAEANGGFQGRHGRTKALLVLGAWVGCKLLALGSPQVLPTQPGASPHRSLGPNPEAATSPREDPSHRPTSSAPWVTGTPHSWLHVPRRHSQADPSSVPRVSSLLP